MSIDLFTTPDEMLHDCWHRLLCATRDGRHPMRTPVVGTMSPAAGEVQLRTVVLREVDIAARQLVFFSDARAAKAAQLRQAPVVSWLFYDPLRQFQVRAAGAVLLCQGDAAARRRWDHLGLEGRKNYGAIQPPGTPAAGAGRGLPDVWATGEMDAGQSEYAFEHFLVVESYITSMDLLLLHPRGHQRAVFRWQENEGNWAGHWVVA